MVLIFFLLLPLKILISNDLRTRDRVSCGYNLEPQGFIAKILRSKDLHSG